MDCGSVPSFILNAMGYDCNAVAFVYLHSQNFMTKWIIPSTSASPRRATAWKAG